MDKDVFMMSESMVESHVLMTSASTAHGWVYNGFLSSLVAYADTVVAKQGAIEGVSRLRACTHVTDSDVVT